MDTGVVKAICLIKDDFQFLGRDNCMVFGTIHRKIILKRVFVYSVIFIKIIA